MSKRHLVNRRRAYSRSRHDFCSRLRPSRPGRSDLAVWMAAGGPSGASRDAGAQPEASDALPAASSTAEAPSSRADVFPRGVGAGPFATT